MAAAHRFPAILAVVAILAGPGAAGFAAAHTRAGADTPAFAAELGLDAERAAVTPETPRPAAPSAPPHFAAAAVAPSLAPLLALAAVALGLGLARPRRALALTLAVLLALLAFETGLHSVHHLGQADQGAACAVASATPHLAATDVADVADIAAPPPMARHSLDPEPRSPRALAAPFEDGRAPPASRS